MYDLFFQQFNKLVSLTEQDEELIRQYLKFKKLRRRQYILQEGDVCRAFAFINVGIMRQYYIDEQGNENIIQFALENCSMGDLYSFLTGEPSQYNIDTLEDCDVVLIDKTAHDELTEKMPKFERFSRLQMSSAYIGLQRRLTAMISLTVEERYELFLKDFPNIVQRVPQHMIASYMGLTPETLSRARKRAAIRR